MVTRTCQTCKHYEPSSVWRRGWCRNPRLYTPQQSHLVDQDGLDCSRGLGNSWEPVDDDARRPVQPAADRAPLRLFAPGPQLAPAGMLATSSGYGAGSGGSGYGGYGGGGSGFGGPPGPPDRGGPPGDRAVNYQPEERYWTDYLRIALPVIGLLLMLGLFWYWAAALIDDESDTPPTEAPLAAATVINAQTATPTAVGTVGITVTAGPPATNTPTGQPPVAPATNTPPTSGQTTAPTPAPGRGPEVEFPVGTVVVTIDDNVNMRDGPSANTAGVVRNLPLGTELTIQGTWVEGDDGRIWWPVTLVAEPGVTGYMADEFIVAR